MNRSHKMAALCAGLMIVSATSGIGAMAIDSNSYQTNSSVVYAADNTYTARHNLVNANSTEKTKRTYDYICDNFGKKIITAQQESTWKGTPDYEVNYIESKTGKLPAMRGMDFMNGDFNGVVNRAKAWDAKGGLVTICWHTGVAGKGYNGSKDENPDFDKLLTPGTEEYNSMIANWDKAADALKELQNNNVTVFWRPFHEFDGQWFWWGKGGPENFKKLWKMMYNYFTDTKGLNNLIWVLGYTGDYEEYSDGTPKDWADWNPGEEYYDIIGSDSYYNGSNDTYKTNKDSFDVLQEMNTSNKPMCYHECGDNIPVMETFKDKGAMWSWFMMWHDHVLQTNDETLNSIYNSDIAITIDELPDMATYTYEEETSSSESSSSSESTTTTTTTSSSESETPDSNSSTTTTTTTVTTDDSSSSVSTTTTTTTSTTTAAVTTAASTPTNTTTATADKSNPNTGAKSGLIGISITSALAAVIVAIKKKDK